MKNFKLTIEYDGRSFNGWQLQNYTDNTIQHHIEKALHILLKEKVKIFAAGRTDSGVSAFGQAANLFYDKDLTHHRILYSLNSLLPPEITIRGINEVPLKFNARRSAKKREYIYQVSTHRRSINADQYFYPRGELDLDRINKCILFLKGKHSFVSVCKNKSDKHNFECNIYELSYKVHKQKGEIIFKIVADRFLHSMVRALMGLLIDAGKKKTEPKAIESKFIKGEKLKTTYLPAQPLFLNKIYY
ncbi:tRNA pseudouridine(38-40) synthase TruA [soil metagenome]